MVEKTKFSYGIISLFKKSKGITMKEIAILLDSTCNMTKELMERFDVDYFKMGVSVGDEEHEASLTWEDYTPHQFYDIMRSGTRVFTIQVQDHTYRDRFVKLVQEGRDVLYIACSGALSASVKAASKVADEVMKEYPDSKIVVVDSLCAGMGQGLMGIKASEMRSEGKSIEEIRDYLEANKLKFNQWATVGDLNYLKRAGRIKASKAFFGNLFGVKPIIISDIKGNNFAYKKVKGRKAALQELVDSAKNSFVDGYISIDHGDCEADALELKRMLEEAGVKAKEIFIVPLGPILGASCGPDTIAIYHFGSEVTILGE